MAEAHSENGNTARSEHSEDVGADTGLRGRAWTWGYHDPCRTQAFDLVQGALVIPQHEGFCAERPEVLDEIERE